MSIKLPLTKLISTKDAKDLASVTKTITVNNQEVEVKQYLPIEEKNNLIISAIEKSLDKRGFIDPVSLDIIFHINIILAYTNITVTPKQKENICGAYDMLVVSGALDLILNAIPEHEYSTLFEYLHEKQKYYETASGSILNVISTLLESTKNNENLKEIKDFLEYAKNVE